MVVASMTGLMVCVGPVSDNAQADSGANHTGSGLGQRSTPRGAVQREPEMDASLHRLLSNPLLQCDMDKDDDFDCADVERLRACVASIPTNNCPTRTAGKPAARPSRPVETVAPTASQ